MMNQDLPTLEQVKKYYEIKYNNYGILMYHPVTTENMLLKEHAKILVDAVIDSNRNYIVVYPNNDLGYEFILNEYEKINNNNKFRVFPSIRFEYFLTLLKNADFIIGNSSAGIRESGIYGIPAIDVGTRQNGRYDLNISKNVQHVFENKKDILNAINNVDKFMIKNNIFGNGNSKEMFCNILESLDLRKIDIQKKFIDYVL